MPVNTTVSHVSPLLSYIPRSAWFEGNSSDPHLSRYSQSSYHATNATGSGMASVTFSWWGTAIWVYGGYRSWSGDFQVILDGVSSQYNGYNSGDPEDFNQLRFAQDDLPYGSHQIRLINTSQDPIRPILDVDYLVFESPLGEIQVVEHTDPQCAWHPDTPNAWQIDAVSHSTIDSFGGMELNFTGSAIELYGTLDAESAPLSVSIDGFTYPPSIPNTAIEPIINDPHILFARTDLGEGDHILRVENNPTSSLGGPSRINITHSKILSNLAARHSSPLPPTEPSDSSSGTTPKRIEIIVAASFGALGFFLLCILIWRLAVHFRRKTQRKRDVLVARPFLARTDPFSPSTPPVSPSGAYARAPTASWDLPPPRRRTGDTDIMRQVDALRRSFTRMLKSRLPPPLPISISVPRAGPSADTDAFSGQERPYSGMQRHRRRPTSAATSSSCTVYESMSAHAPDSPLLPMSPTASGSGFGLGSSRAAAAAAGTAGRGEAEAVAVTLPLRVGRRRSIEKPPFMMRMQLVGSPVASLPSSRGGGRSLPLPPLPHRTGPRTPPAFGELEVDQGPPPAYRFLDMH